MKHGKKYTDSAKLLDRATLYEPNEALELCTKTGKAKFDEILGGFIVKPQGKPTLVPESDKRPAMNNAKNDFMEDK